MADRLSDWTKVLELVKRDDLEGLKRIAEERGADAALAIYLHQVKPELRMRQQNIKTDMKICELGSRTIEPVSPVHLAAKQGNIKIIDYFINMGVSPTQTTLLDQLTPLHFASHEGKTDMVKYLVSQSGGVNIQDRHGRTPLHLCVARGHIDITKYLIEKGAELNLKTEPSDGGRTVLHIAVAKGYKFLTNLLLEQGAKSIINMPQNRDGQTALHLAATAGIPALVQMLLMTGASTNTQDTQGNSPLAMVTKTTGGLREDRRNCLRQLSICCDVNIGDKVGLRPLHHASFMNRPTQIQILLSHGAHIDAVGDYGCTPLHYAFLNSNAVCSRAATELLENGASVNARDHEGRGALHLYSLHGKPPAELGKLLLAKGSDVNMVDGYNRAPLHYAVIRGSSQVALFLLEHGANCNLTDKHGNSPLHYVSQNTLGSTNIIFILADHGADMNAKNCEGQTPLHLSARLPYPDVTQALLCKKADIGAIDEQGETALHCAVDYANKNKDGEVTSNCACAIIDTLIKQGAHINAEDHNKKTPLIHAVQSGVDNTDIARRLVVHGADVNHKDASGQSALLYAKDKKLDKFLSLLAQPNNDLHNHCVTESLDQCHINEL